MKHLEDKLQMECVRWFRYQYPDVVIFAIPNGGARDAVTGALMKKTGTLAGVADLFVMKASYCFYESDPFAKDYYGLFIEMKAGKGQQTPAQKDFEAKATNAGYMYQVCRSFDEFKETIENYLS